jgi:FkbM family methyltransferase
MSLPSLLYKLNHATLWQRSVRVWGQKMKASSLDRLLCLWLHRLGLMGKPDRRLLEKHVAPGMKVVDIGANVGLHSLLLAQLVGTQGHVFAFEPEPSLFRALARNCRRNGVKNLTLFNQALGDQTGRIGFSRSIFNSGDNRLGDLGWKGYGVEVEIARLDDHFAGRPIDFIKLDVQGYEMQVLRGMEEVLRANQELEICIEFWPLGLRAAGTEPTAVLDHLYERGFRIFESDGNSLRLLSSASSICDRVTGSHYTNLLASRHS